MCNYLYGTMVSIRVMSPTLDSSSIGKLVKLVSNNPELNKGSVHESGLRG